MSGYSRKATARPIDVIAAEIVHDWEKPYFGAVPYLQAMLCLDSLHEMYGCDSAQSIVQYFLINATTWRGKTARRVKAELNAMIKDRETAAHRLLRTIASRDN